MTESELKPCPFCGHADPLLITHRSDAGNEYSVKCYQGCCEIADEYHDAAVRDWNRRTHPPEYARLIEAAEKVAPHLDAIICYASTMGEHEPNRIAHEFRAALAAIKGIDNAQG